MDLKKEIRFRDLLPRKRAKSADPGRAPRPRVERQSKSGAPKRLVGLKIGASQIAAAEVVNNGAPELVQVARMGLEPGVVVGGEVRDPAALTAALAEFFKRHKLPKRGVRLGVANNRIGVRAFDLAGVDDPKQLTNAIRFRAQEVLPIPLHEAVLDFQILDESVDEEGRKAHRVLLVVAYRELVDRYVEACSAAGIQLAGIDLEAFALLRALTPVQPGPDAQAVDGDAARAATVAISIGYDRSTLAVSDGRVCEFTRVLEWGGGTLNIAIARALDLAPSEAEPIKRSLSLADQDAPHEPGDENASKAREAVRRELQSFAREVLSSLTFYQSQPGSLGISGIALTGGTAHLLGLADELQRLVGVAVRLGDPLSRVRAGKALTIDEQLGSLTVAIGLGIEA
jgi:type IV pilus assembly protein PilM